MTGIFLIFAITVVESILQLCANVFIDWNCFSYKRCDPWVSFCFYSRSTGPSSTKLGTKHYRVMRIQIYSNEMPSLFQGKNNSKKQKNLFIDILKSSSASTGPISTKLATKHLWFMDSLFKRSTTPLYKGRLQQKTSYKHFCIFFFIAQSILE